MTTQSSCSPRWPGPSWQVDKGTHHLPRPGRRGPHTYGGLSSEECRVYPKAVPGSAGSKAVPEGRTGVSALTLLTQSLPGRYSRPGFGPARPPLSPQGYRLKRALPPPTVSLSILSPHSLFSPSPCPCSGWAVTRRCGQSGCRGVALDGIRRLKRAAQGVCVLAWAGRARYLVPHGRPNTQYQIPDTRYAPVGGEGGYRTLNAWRGGGRRCASRSRCARARSASSARRW